MSDANKPTSLSLHSEDAMTRFGRRIAAYLVPGDAILLSGPIGAGKTHLARAIIQPLLDREEEVPSPTYTLVQTYETPIAAVLHADLYRLGDSSELIELGLDEAIGEAILLIEWPDRLPAEFLPKDGLNITICPEGETRSLDFTYTSERWAKPLEELVDG